MKSIFLMITVLLTVINISNAQIVTDRPDQTEAASTVPNASLQIETGTQMSFEGEIKSSSQLVLPTTLFRYGLVKGVELRVLNQLEFVTNNSIQNQGVSDIQVGTKVQLYSKTDSKTQVALLSHVILPSGTKELSANKVGTINKLSVSRVLTESLGLGMNIGYDYFGVDKGNFTYSLSLGSSINSKLSVYIEPYGEVTNFNNHLASFDTGLAYLIKNNLQFDFSFGIGINHRMNYISTGISWLIERNK